MQYNITDATPDVLPADISGRRNYVRLVSNPYAGFVNSRRERAIAMLEKVIAIKASINSNSDS